MFAVRPAANHMKLEGMNHTPPCRPCQMANAQSAACEPLEEGGGVICPRQATRNDRPPSRPRSCPSCPSSCRAPLTPTLACHAHAPAILDATPASSTRRHTATLRPAEPHPPSLQTLQRRPCQGCCRCRVGACRRSRSSRFRPACIRQSSVAEAAQQRSRVRGSIRIIWGGWHRGDQPPHIALLPEDKHFCNSPQFCLLVNCTGGSTPPCCKPATRPPVVISIAMVLTRPAACEQSCITACIDIDASCRSSSTPPHRPRLGRLPLDKDYRSWR